MIRLSPLDLPASGDPDSTWSNPPKLSLKVRELAHRSHRALKVETSPHFPPSQNAPASQLDLRELMTQLTRLQQKIHALGLRGLFPWIDTLKRQVETRLKSTESEASP